MKLQLEVELLRKQNGRADQLYTLAMIRFICWCVIGVSGIVVAVIALLRFETPG